jgi:hypothetical protein
MNFTHNGQYFILIHLLSFGFFAVSFAKDNHGPAQVIEKASARQLGTSLAHPEGWGKKGGLDL